MLIKATFLGSQWPLYTGLIVPLQSEHNTTIVVSLNPAHGDVYSIQHYVIKLSLTCGRSAVFSG